MLEEVYRHGFQLEGEDLRDQPGGQEGEGEMIFTFRIMSWKDKLDLRIFFDWAADGASPSKGG